jgi:CRP/FNR family cyclic AMP-dependent transcriptional regulator
VIQEFLRRVALFKGLSDDDLAQVLMVGLVRRHAAGSVILAEGAPGGRLHVLHRGQVRIGKLIPGMGEEALAILSPGDFFGEVEFFDGAPASASAVAHTDCETFSIPHAEVRALMGERPEVAARFLWTFAGTLATRLREADRKLAALLSLTNEPRPPLAG